jgi:hypothetical protein
METLDFAVGVFPECISHLLVPHRDGDRQIDVGGLHDLLVS